jgi:pimeloyl-ACP methyl ester carboxylesterase
MTTAITGWTESFVDVAGHAIHVSRAGTGRPVVLLPDDIGVPCWLPFHERLSRRFELILVSHPGFGRSQRPAWARNVRDLAALESALFRELGFERPAVVGFGLGGWLAAELATQCGPCFERMILVAPCGLQPENGVIHDQFLGRGPAYARAGFSDPARFEATYGEEPDIDTLEAWEINREMTARIAWSPYLFSQSLPHLLPLVEVPALVAWGTQDAIIPPAEAHHWARLLPDARVEFIEDCGHRVDIEQPDALARAIESFLGAP